MRLDQYLVANCNIQTRNKAIQMIENNYIYINDEICNKKNYLVKENDIVVIKKKLDFVSRGGEKLALANKEFKINFNNKIVVDFGSSTGGFAHYAILQNVKKIYCVDVGIDQLDNLVKNDARVINLEKTNIKDLNQEIISDNIDIITSDLSFISCTVIFKIINKLLLNKNFNLVCLIKPQFELNAKIISKTKGFVPKKYHEMIITKVKKIANEEGFIIKKIIPSQVLGAKKKNQEYLMWATKNE